MNNIRVAVVDDNPVYLFALVTLLKQNNELDVVIAKDNFKDLLDEMLEEELELIIIDESVVRGIRENVWAGFLKYVREIPVIIMGLNGAEEIDNFRGIHPKIRYMSKEADSTKIYNEIEKYLRCIS
jgi:DNA-binding NarL/FixJ family response regulator